MEKKQAPKAGGRMTRLQSLQARLGVSSQNLSNVLSNTPEHVKSPAIGNADVGTISPTAQHESCKKCETNASPTTNLFKYSRRFALDPTAQHGSYKKCKTITVGHASPVEAKVADTHPPDNTNEPETSVAENFNERLGEHPSTEFLQFEARVHNHVESILSSPIPVVVGIQNGTGATPSTHVPSINSADALLHTPYVTASDLGQEQMGNITVASNAVEETPKQNGCNSVLDFGHPSKSCSIGLTEMLNMDAGEDTDEDEVEYPHLVHGYRVKEGLAHVLRNIIDKHGDIASDCIMTTLRFRSSALEGICQIVEKFQSKPFCELKQVEIEEALTEVTDIGQTGMVVSWMQESLADMLEAKRLVKEPNLKMRLQNLNQVKTEMENEVEVLRAQLNSAEEKREAANTDYLKLKGAILKATDYYMNRILPFGGLL